MKNLESILEDSANEMDFSFLSESQDNSLVDMSTPNIVPVQEYSIKRENFSFNQPIPENEPEVNDPDDPDYIIHNIWIDKFNSKAVRIEVTPSVCRICGFDVAKAKHERWGLVPASERKTVIEALAEHKKVVHTLGDLHIIKKSQLPRQWLGSNNL
jgi:hypothetical protein